MWFLVTAAAVLSLAVKALAAPTSMTVSCSAPLASACLEGPPSAGGESSATAYYDDDNVNTSGW